MLDKLHDDDLPLDAQDHLVRLDIGIAQAHATCVDERPWNDLDRRLLTCLIVHRETDTTGSTLTDELVQPPVADVLGIIVLALLFPLEA